METPEVGFQLAKIEVEEFAIRSLNFDGKKPIQFDQNYGFAADFFRHAVAVSMSVNMRQEGEVLATLSIQCIFEIAPATWEDFSSEKNAGITMPTEFALGMASVTIGTFRGILFEKLTRTDLRNNHFPLVDLTDMIIEDVHIPFPQPEA